MVRTALVAILLLALSQPAWRKATHEQSVIFVLDHSQSQGEQGIRTAYRRASALAAALPSDTSVGYVSAGESARVLLAPTRSRQPLEPDLKLLADDGAQTDLERAVLVARGLFPPSALRRLVIVSDGMQTRGDLEEAAREAAVAGVVIDAVGIAGQPRLDVRIVRLRTSRSQLNVGAFARLIRRCGKFAGRDRSHPVVRKRH